MKFCANKQTDRQTDRQTDKQTDPNAIASPSARVITFKSPETTCSQDDIKKSVRRTFTVSFQNVLFYYIYTKSFKKFTIIEKGLSFGLGESEINLKWDSLANFIW